MSAASELVSKYLACSTGCLPHEEFQRLGAGSSLITIDHEYGVEVWVRAAEDMSKVREHFPHLAAVMDLARSLGCSWIDFDQDADPIDELPYFEW